MKTCLIFFVISILLRGVVKIECVLGGQNATEGQFPYQVSIQLLQEGMRNHFAGGVIVASRFVLTTATLKDWYEHHSNDTIILFGTIDKSAETKKMGIETVTFHPSFDYLTMKDDIAIVHTSEAFIFTEFVKSLNLPTLDLSVEGGTKANIAGWNFIDNHLTFSTTVTISTANCRSLIKDRVIHDTNVCTTNPDNVGICYGDYGSPLVDEKQMVVALASVSGIECVQGFPDVYTRVQPYVNWINSIISNPTSTSTQASTSTSSSNTINMIQSLIILQTFVIFVNLN